MKNFKNRIQNIKSMFKGIFERFPITILVVFIITLFLTIIFDTDWISGDKLANILLFSTIFASSTFLIEEKIINEKSERNIWYLLSAVLSLNAKHMTWIKCVQIHFYPSTQSIK